MLSDCPTKQPSPSATDLTNPDLAGLNSLLLASALATTVSREALCVVTFPISPLSEYDGAHPGHAFLCGVNLEDPKSTLLLQL